MKTPQTNDSLSKAVAALGAVEVAPGRYAIELAGENEPWHWGIIRQEILEEYGVLLKAKESDPDADEEHWPGGSQVVEMPAWWSPDQRFAWRETQSVYRGAVKDKKGGLVLIASPAFDADNVTRLRPPHWRRITADLTTGAEVPACD